MTSVLVACAASLARKVYLRQNIGVGQFRRQYGGRNDRCGTCPQHFKRASGGLIRHILKQLEVRWTDLSCFTLSSSGFTCPIYSPPLGLV